MNDNKGDALFPHSIWDRVDVCISARLLYDILWTYAEAGGACTPKTSTLADSLGVSHKVIGRLIRNLEQADLVRVKRVRRNMNQYALDDPKRSQR